MCLHLVVVAQNLYRKFVKDEEPPAEFTALLGANRFYNVDLIPKFIMANGVPIDKPCSHSHSLF
jgi:RAB protein geranylgeranyltransferase component A